jgi:outer membrane protein assembly factor BamE (lipoprotein component of BamABCDE complex)
MQKHFWPVLLVLLFSCSKSLPSFDNIDLYKWKEDKNGCLGDRIRSLDALRQQKDKLKALSEMEIISLLGRPDRNELYKRNQKFYYYFLEAGVVCGIDKESPKRLSIRFNAMGLAKEVVIE